MGNTLKSYVEVDLNGKNKLLKFDFNAVADIEEYFQKGITAIFREDQVGFNTIRIFYWAGLKWKDRGLTPQLCGNWLQDKLDEGAEFTDLMGPIMKALQLSGVMGRQEAEDQEENEENEKN